MFWALGCLGGKDQQYLGCLGGKCFGMIRRRIECLAGEKTDQEYNGANQHCADQRTLSKATIPPTATIRLQYKINQLAKGK